MDLEHGVDFGVLSGEGKGIMDSRLIRFAKKIFLVGVLTGLCLTVAAAEGDESHFLSNTRQLTFEGRSGEGYFSPDGKILIFQSEREPGNPFYQIYLLSFESGDITRVSPGIGKTTCSFFRPGSDEVLFASTHLDPKAKEKQKAELEFRASGKTRRYSWDYDEQMDIFSAHRDGTNPRRLTDAPGYDAEGSYSPDGKQIVFSSMRNAFPIEKLGGEEKKRYETDPAYFAELYIMNADGSDQRRLTQWPGYDGGPFFSPDGKRIIWRHFEENGAIADVYSMKLDGSDIRRITDFKSMSWAPYSNPSGKYIVFTSNKHGFGNFELFIVDSEGKHEPVRVTYTDGFDGLPVFSADGKKLCWTSNRTSEKQSQLFLADWNDEAALQALAQAPARQVSTAQTQEVAGPESRFSPEIRAEDCKALVGTLASDEFEGRLTGTEGAKKASDYIASTLQKIGVPALRDNDYFDRFEFTSGVEVKTNGTALTISKTTPKSFEVDKDFRPLSFSDNGSVDGSVVFVGYGLSMPGKPGEGYDSYAGLDVTNKIVLGLRYVPEGVDSKRRQELNRYAALRYKAMIAREHGAKGILIVAGPNSPNAGELIALSNDGSLSGSSILAASISTNVAEALLASAGKSLKELQDGLDKENPHTEGSMALTNVTVRLYVALNHVKKEDRNVLAAVTSPKLRDYILVGAHYDHLGRGETTSSREQAGEAGQVHNGADDNASGVAAVLELAGSLAADENARAKLAHNIIFAFWSGEELGLLGSAHFVEQSPVTLTNIVACVNFDMVGRLHENKLMLQGTGSSPIWRKLVEKRNIAAGFSAILQDDPYLPTDVTSFYPKGIPVLSFFTGSHDDYHRPTDDPDKINYEGMERITKMARGMVLDLATNAARPEYVKVERSNEGGNRDALRVYLGTIPDYTSEVKGVKLSGVRGGSPAEKGGLKGGDIIVEFAGQKIANIYDYTYALDAAKIGKPLQIAVEREGQRVPLTVTPEARK
jgi:Tol biopolymer transport system component